VRLAGQGQDHVRSNRAHHADEVLQDLVAPPLRVRFVDAERHPEIVGAGEILLHPVAAVDGVQLLRAQDAEGLAQLGADLVLPAFAPRGREQRYPHAQAAREGGDGRVVLVVGVGGDDEDGRQVREPAQAQAEGSGARRRGRRPRGSDRRLRRKRAGQEGKHGDRGERPPAQKQHSTILRAWRQTRTLT
jgi:hypothetical protein